VFNETSGSANRATFLIGQDAVVVDTFASDDLGTPRERDRYHEAVAKL
jgi:peroxiredoxin